MISVANSDSLIPWRGWILLSVRYIPFQFNIISELATLPCLNKITWDLRSLLHIGSIFPISLVSNGCQDIIGSQSWLTKAIAEINAKLILPK